MGSGREISIGFKEGSTGSVCGMDDNDDGGGCDAVVILSFFLQVSVQKVVMGIMSSSSSRELLRERRVELLKRLLYVLDVCD